MRADEAAEDHEVPHQRAERRDREVVVGVEDPDEEPVEPEDHDDREQHAAEADGQVDELRGELSPVKSGMITPAATMNSDRDRAEHA